MLIISNKKWAFILMVWFGLWCLTPLSTIFELYHGSQFYWWRKLEYPEKTNEFILSISNILLYQQCVHMTID
jgi:hypothetical protein